MIRGYDHPHAVRLLAALYREQLDLYGFADSPEADPDEFAPPEGLFVVAYTRSRKPVGCGGYHRHPKTQHTVEIRKMYVLGSHRGHGIGGLILDRLEQQAAAQGATRIVLETGVLNASALGLYRSRGYQPTLSYVPGRNPDVNRAFAKQLTLR